MVLVFAVYWLLPESHEIVNAEPRGETIVCFGDSLTAGVGAAAEMDYPAQLARLIDERVVNAGVSGDTTAEALARLDRVIALSPRIVLVTLGGNDLKNGMSRDRAFANLAVIVRRIQGEGALVVIGGLEIPFWGRGFGDAYKKLARETGSLLVPDVYRGIINSPELMSDRIHPNGKGYAIMAQHFHEAIKPYL